MAYAQAAAHAAHAAHAPHGAQATHIPARPATDVDGFAALGDHTRRAIFEMVAGRARSVGELAGDLPVSRPAVSQHLRVLREAGLVRDRADGARRIYELDPAGVNALRAYLDQFWNQALASFKAAAERPKENP